MPSLFDANIPARDIGASVIQVVAGRANPIGGVSVYITGTATGDAYVMVQFYKFGPT